jgi:hypothetical protein
MHLNSQGANLHSLYTTGNVALSSGETYVKMMPNGQLLDAAARSLPTPEMSPPEHADKEATYNNANQAYINHSMNHANSVRQYVQPLQSNAPPQMYASSKPTFSPTSTRCPSTGSMYENPVSELITKFSPTSSTFLKNVCPPFRRNEPPQSPPLPIHSSAVTASTYLPPLSQAPMAQYSYSDQIHGGPIKYEYEYGMPSHSESVSIAVSSAGTWSYADQPSSVYYPQSLSTVQSINGPCLSASQSSSDPQLIGYYSHDSLLMNPESAQLMYSNETAYMNHMNGHAMNASNVALQYAAAHHQMDDGFIGALTEAAETISS